MVLCHFCVALDLGALIEKACQDTDFGSSDYHVYGSQHPVTHRTKHDLRRNADGGCELCRFFWTAFSETGSVCDDDPAGNGEGLCALPIKVRIRVEQCHGDYSPTRAACYALEIQKPHREEDWYEDETWSVYSLERLEVGSPYVMTSRPSNILQRELWLGWIADCQASHRGCLHPTECPSPTRLLRIDQASDTVRLVEVFGSKIDYVALSYCWGQGASLTTTASNYASRLANIERSDLPLTFRDAADITRALGYEYLWIDSLCIIQDSVSDWQHECARMQYVYCGAVLTIAADQAENPSSGLLGAIPTYAEHQCEITVVWPSSLTTERLILKGPYKRHTEHTNIVGRSGPLSTRAWAVQERLLSSRVLHIRGSRSHFECSAGRRMDVLPHLLPLTHPLDDFYGLGTRKDVVRPTLAVGRHDWYKLVAHYASCKLTQARDRLPAFSGVARAVESTFSSRYLAGIWESDLTLGLAWMCESHVTLSSHPATTQGPTWSWTSCDKPIFYYWATEDVDRQAWDVQHDLRDILCRNVNCDTWISCLDLVGAEIETFGGDPFAEVKRGRLSVRGRGQPFGIAEWIENPVGRAMHHITFPGHDISPFHMDVLENPRITLDRARDSLPESTELLCLLLGVNFDQSDHGRLGRRSWYALGLQPVTGERKAYQRVGLIYMYDRSDEMDEEWEAVVQWLMAGDIGEIHLV